MEFYDWPADYLHIRDKGSLIDYWYIPNRSHAWRCDAVETFSALLVLVAGNPRVVPLQKQTMRCFDVFRVVRQYAQLNKQARYRRFEAP